MLKLLEPVLSEVDFSRAPFDQVAHLRLALGANWTELSVLNSALLDVLKHSGITLKFVEQNKELLSDELSFEQRIAERGEIATRVASLHDFYSALMWLRFPKVKLAINAIHLHGIAQHGTKVRSRHQQAVTHLDEAGAWVVSNHADLLGLIDAHAWQALFFANRSAWSLAQNQKNSASSTSGPAIEARVFGHAIFELMHAPHKLVAAKVVWIVVDAHYFLLSNAEKDAALDTLVGAALTNGTVSGDPKLLSTLPLSGIPGWWPEQDTVFYASAPCFRPRPESRIYSPALVLTTPLVAVSSPSY